MYKREFDKHISNNKLSSAIMLFGESSFLIDRYIKILSNMKLDALKLTIYYDDYVFSEALSHLTQGSLFNNSNILIIKTEKKIPKLELDKLVRAISLNPSNFFIYAYYGKDYKTSDKAFQLKAGGMSVRFFSPNYNESIAILQDSARLLQLNINKHALSHLLEIHNNNLEFTSQELDKLALYDKEIDIELIDNLVYGLSHVKMDKFLEDVLLKHEILDNLHHIVQSGEDEISIITALTSFVTQLYLFNLYIRINGAPDSKAILGYNIPSFVLQNKAALSLKFKPTQYFEMLDILLHAQLLIKLGHGDKQALLFSVILKFQKIS